ncbi:uncharacterized protein Dok [Drosophila tropicalis]|uniref:uncharacterized protein Dok n=1 Tax=Drosophila tropicalis TaxID=46794 RepID=UPI0035ABB189
MDVEIPVLAGYLNVPTQTGFSLNRISKKKTCGRYCLLFKASRHGIARLEIGESKDDKNPKIFVLGDCVKITKEAANNLIHIVKHNGTLALNTNGDEELKDWLKALQTVAFCDTNTGHHGTNHGSHGAAIEEDNDLYCSSFDGLFMITLIPSEASIRCNIEPKTYMLQMTPTELQLKSEDLNVTIAMWPYRFIRKYGYRDGKFTFEAGRKCTTGEGVFTLDHTNPQEVFRCMSAKMKSMKKLINGSDSLSSIECVENQFSAVAGMEPGSRSPLPPSPSSNPLNAAEFEINSTQSCISLRGFISSNDSLNNFSANNSGAGGVGGGVTAAAANKHIPNKPPRKLPNPVPVAPPHCDKYKNIVKYEPVAITTSSPADATGSAVILKPGSPDSLHRASPPDLPLRNESVIKPLMERDYECIENITDAWKTRGVGDVRHCERIPSILCDSGDFVRQQQRDKRLTPTAGTPKIIDIDIGEGNGSALPLPLPPPPSSSIVGVLVSSTPPDANYDRLDFLSPNNKTSSGYKTIVNVTLPVNRLPPPPNEYELIASPDTESFRKADDSHLGYGVLRKSSTSNTTTTNNNNNNNNQNHTNNNNNHNSTNSTTATSTTSVGICISSSSNNNNNNNESSSISSSISSSNSVSTALDHRSYNGLNYTIVSKPKRV